jgi:hypothetical protein
MGLFSRFLFWPLPQALRDPPLARLRRLLLVGHLRQLLLDRLFQLQRAGRQHVGLGLDQEGVEAAAVVDALDGVGRDPQAHVAAERVRDEGDVAQVRQEPALGLDIGVAHLVTHQRPLGRQFAAPCHRDKSSAFPGLIRKPQRARRGGSNLVHPGNGGRIGGGRRGVKVLGVKTPFPERLARVRII